MSTSTSRRRLMLAAGAAPCFYGLPLVEAAAATPQAAVEEFFRMPLLKNLRLSPNGRYVAGVRTNAKGIDNATVHEIATGKTLVITNFSDSSVSWIEWVNNDRLILSLIDLTRGSGEQMSGGLNLIERDGSNYRPIAERSNLSSAAKLLPFGSSFEGWVLTETGARTDDIIAMSSSFTTARGKMDSNLYRLNTVTGRFTLITSGGPKNVVQWAVDRAGVPRAAVSSMDDRITVSYRKSASDPWAVIFEYDAQEGDKAVVPLAFDAAGQLYVSANAGADCSAIYRYDPAKRRLDADPLVAVNGFDITGGLRFAADGSLAGVRLEADRPVTVWFDDARGRIQAGVDKAWPDSVNDLQFTTEGKGPVLVHSWSDRDPGRFFLYNTEENRMAEIGKERPWVSPDAMRPTKFFRFDAPDGLSIPGQLTLPEGKGPHPLVVLHYGGPWVRPIHWKWDPVVQFLASRGYAVYMPAPRASTGFGNKLFRSGWRQWGLGMQDDVTAGVEYLIKQGQVDRSRVGILGASYGGYLAMMALVKEPKLFRCAVNWVGVTDPSFMFTVTWTDFSRVDQARFSLSRLIGDPDKDKEQFRRTSPVERAAEITQPVLMAYGGLDRRVPIVNGERMRSALQSNGKQPEWVVYPEEGHGWLKESNQIDFWTRVERFLARNMAEKGA